MENLVMKYTIFRNGILCTVMSGLTFGMSATAQTTTKESSTRDSSLIVHCQNYQLKPRLKDRGSYKRTGKHVERKDGEIGVYIRYSAKNSFGGRIEQMVECVYDLQGRIKRFHEVS